MDIKTEINLALAGFTTKTAGKLVPFDMGDDYVDLKPTHRERLDHYGNGGDGWDLDSWENDYAAPLAREVRLQLISRGIFEDVFSIEIGEKGFVIVSISHKYA